MQTIGIVANSCWNIYNFRMKLIGKLMQQNKNVIVFAPVDEFISYQKSFPSVRHVALQQLDRDGTSALKEFALIFELIKEYRHHKPDLIIHFTVKPNTYGAIAAYIAGIPSIGVVTGLGFPFLHGGVLQIVVKFLYRLSARLHRKVIFENDEDLDYFVQRKIASPEKCVTVQGCGVDIQYFKPRPNGLYPGKTIFTFVGRLLYDKGIREFVEAAEQVKAIYQNAEFWVVGNIDKENPSSVREKELIQWNNSRIIQYHGSTLDIRPFIAHSDCIVLPSYREAIPRALTEAMAMQRPVITTDVAGCRAAVDNNINGFLVPVKNSAKLAQAMIKFIGLEPDKRDRMGVAGRIKVIEEFDDQSIASDICAIVNSVLQKN